MLKIIEIIKQKIKQLINKKSIALNSKSSEFEKNIKNKDKGKKEFFELYKNVKNGSIKLENLMINDLIKVQLIMQQEKEFLDNKIINDLEKIKEMNEKIDIFHKRTNK